MPVPETPVPHEEPFAIRLNAEVLVAGWHVEHALVGLGAFAAYVTPEIRQPRTQFVPEPV